jgi:multiple sugar transport system permease protein
VIDTDGSQEQIAVERAAAQVPSLRIRLARRWHRHWLPYGLLAPAAFLIIVVQLVPILEGIWFSFLRLDSYHMRQFLGAPFIGLENYRQFLFVKANTLHADALPALRTTLIAALVIITFSLTLGMLVALLLNSLPRPLRFLGVLVILPWVIPTWVIGQLWVYIWDREGIVNKILVNWSGLLSHPPDWFRGFDSFIATVLPSIWQSYAFAALVFLAALRAIPHELYEAAEMDGANGWRQFWRITLPNMKGIVAIVVLVAIIFSLYDYPLFSQTALTGITPDRWSSEYVPIVIQDSVLGFPHWGAAASTVLMSALLVIVLIWYAAFRKSLVSR